MAFRSCLRMTARHAARRLSPGSSGDSRRSLRPQYDSQSGRVRYPGTAFGVLGSIALLWKSVLADDTPAPAAAVAMLDPETASEEELKRMMTMMVEDSKCPSCARAMLQGPCGMQLLQLLLCYSRSDDPSNTEACAVRYGPVLTACMEQHRAYYGLDSEPETDAKPEANQGDVADT